MSYRYFQIPGKRWVPSYVVPPFTLVNTAEGGTDEVAATPGAGGNTGGASGQAFDIVSGNVTFTDDNVATGGLAYRLDDHPSSESSLFWNNPEDGGVSLPSGLQEVYGRLYLYATAWPSNYSVVADLEAALSADSQMFATIDSTGVMRVFDSDAAQQGSNLNLSLNTLYRIEFHCVSHATAGTLELKVFAGHEPTTTLLNVSIVGTASTSGLPIGFLKTALYSPVGNAAYYVDDLGLTNIGWLGPTGVDGAGIAELVASDPNYIGVLDVATFWPPDPFYESAEGGITSSTDVTPQFNPPVVAEPIETLVAADPNYSQSFSGIESLLQPAAVFSQYSEPSVDDAAFIFADRLVSASDTLAVAISDNATMQAFSEIAELVAANYSDFQGIDEAIPLPGLTIEDYHYSSHEVTFIFATVDRAGSDTLAVAITDSATVQVFAEIAELVAANYSNVQGMEEFIPLSGLTIEDYHQSALDTAYVFADVGINGSDTLAVAITDSGSREAFEGIEQLVAANYSSFFGTVEALEAPATSFEGYSYPSTVDVAIIFADVLLAGTDSLAVAITDTATLQTFETIDGLIAAQPGPEPEPYTLVTEDPISIADHSTTLEVTAQFNPPSATQDEYIAALYSQFYGDVEALFGPTISIEDYHNPTVYDVAIIFAEVSPPGTESLAVAISENAVVDRFETIEGLVIAQPGPEPDPYTLITEDPISIADHTTSLEVIAQFNPPPATNDEYISILYSQFYGDVEALFPPMFTIEDYSVSAVTDITWVYADRDMQGSDNLAVAITDNATMQVFEGIEGLVAANYTAFQGTIEALFSPMLTVEDYANPTAYDVATVFADVNLPGTDTLAVAISDNATVERFETVEGLVAADPNYGEPQPNPDDLVLPDLVSLGDHQSTLDVTAQFNPPAVTPDDAILSATNYSTFQGDIEALFPQGLTIEHYSEPTSSDVSSTFVAVLTGADTIAVALSDTGSLTIVEGIEQLIAAQSMYGGMPFGQLEALFPDRQTSEDYANPSSYDVAVVFATVNTPGAETLAVAISDVGSLQIVEHGVVLIAVDPNYGNAIGTVEALFPLFKTIEDWNPTTLDVTVQLAVTFGTPESSLTYDVISDHNTYVAVQDVYEAVDEPDGGEVTT